MLGRCPRCGRGRLFRGFLAVNERCEDRGLDLRDAEDSGDGSVAFIILIVGFVVLGAALVAEVRHGWPIRLHMPVWLPLALVLCLALPRRLEGGLIGLQHRHRGHEFDAGG